MKVHRIGKRNSETIAAFVDLDEENTSRREQKHGYEKLIKKGKHWVNFVDLQRD